ncbi:hypothetical protein NL532_11540 [Mesorhizobium sp. C120A]|uniref:hypothetical protein n=1 Tax=unclassified Mesorhizobium TaxID=325217 RepID=UPI0004CE4E8B|nr:MULTISPECIES: hypothetical protein [unclassified Mesorhizobium]WJI47206.1 hypothetical protein NL532_11540 [Mesorhizobium sp. C120A]
MLLTDSEIRAAQLVKYGSDARYNATSYDLGIGEIIDASGQRHSEVGYAVKPQEIVWLISRENIKLPTDITAHASIRTGLCNNGLLALNIGIVDPTWDGPLSTAVVNFSKSEYFLKIEEKFLRLSFLKHNEPELARVSSPSSRKEYIAERIGLAKTKFGTTFLNVDELSGNVARRIVEKRKESIFLYGAVASMIIGLIVIVISVATYAITFPRYNPYGDFDQRLKLIEQNLKVGGEH